MQNRFESEQPDDMFVGGLSQSPEASLMVALGFEDKTLSHGARMLLGVMVVEHIEQIMRDKWLAWEVRRALKKKHPKFNWDEDVSKPNPFPNIGWSPTRDAICQIITRP
jgi:hypothetical protein